MHSKQFCLHHPKEEKILNRLHANVLTATALLTFAGCSALKETTDTALIPVDATAHYTASGWEATRHFVNAGYEGFIDFFGDMDDGFVQSGLGYYLVSDEAILESRKHYAVWDGGERHDVDSLIRAAIKREGGDLTSVKDMTEHDRLSRLNGIFFERALETHKKAFLKHHPKPTFDQFKTNRVNLQNAREYSLALQKSENDWEMKLPQTRNEVLSRTLDAYYGRPYVENLSYKPNAEALYVDVLSTKNGFKQKIYLNGIDEETGKKMLKQIRNTRPKVYFHLDGDALTLVGITVSTLGKNYVARVTDEGFVRDSAIVMDADEEYRLEDLAINVKEIRANAKVPEWYNEQSDCDEIWAYGSGTTEEEAKQNAYKDLAQKFKVSVKSHQKSDIELRHDQLTENFASTTDIETELEFENTQRLKSEKESLMWYYRAGCLPVGREGDTVICQ